MKSNNAEICVLSIIFKHPKTGLYVHAVECGSRNSFENSIKALELKKVEVIFKCCESESDLFELGLTLHQGFIGAESILGICAASINEEQTKKDDKEKITTSKAVMIPKKVTYPVQRYPQPSVAQLRL